MVASRDVHEIVSKLSSDKAKTREVNFLVIPFNRFLGFMGKTAEKFRLWCIFVACCLDFVVRSRNDALLFPYTAIRLGFCDNFEWVWFEKC